MEWKWSKGETYKRSKRIFNNENNQQSEEYYQKEIYEADIKNKQLELSAYSSSLNYDENTWDI